MLSTVASLSEVYRLYSLINLVLRLSGTLIKLSKLNLEREIKSRRRPLLLLYLISRCESRDVVGEHPPQNVKTNTESPGFPQKEMS